MFAAVLAVVLSVPPASVCARVELDAESPVMSLEDLVPALRARIGRRHLRVTRCTGSDQSRWRLSVLREADGKTLLRLDELDARTTWLELETEGLPRAERVSAVALKAAEALRPSIDAALALEGLLSDAERAEAATAQPVDVEALARAADAPTTAPSPVVEPPASPPWRGTISLEAGALLALAGGPGARGALSGALRRGPVSLSVFAGGRLPHSARRAEALARAFEVDAGAGVDFCWNSLELGVRVGARWSQVVVTSESPAIDVGAQAWWSAVGTLRLAWWPIDLWRLSLGALANGSAVLPTREFLLRGTPLVSQSWFEGGLQLGVRVNL